MLAEGGTLLLADNADRPYKAARREALLERLQTSGIVLRDDARTVRVALQTRQGNTKDIVLAALERRTAEGTAS